jgi:hypothetical protein
MVKGRFEVTVKFNELPDAKQDKDGWSTFEISAGDRVITIALGPKVWSRLVQAAKEWTQWVAVVTGKLGKVGMGGFVLDDPGLQVFEKRVEKGKPSTLSATPVAVPPVSLSVPPEPTVPPEPSVPARPSVPMAMSTTSRMTRSTPSAPLVVWKRRRRSHEGS